MLIISTFVIAVIKQDLKVTPSVYLYIAETAVEASACIQTVLYLILQHCLCR